MSRKQSHLTALVGVCVILAIVLGYAWYEWTYGAKQLAIILVTGLPVLILMFALFGRNKN